MKVTLVTLVVALCMNVRCSGALSADVLFSSGVKGGLVVVIGCDDPELISGLCGNAYVVHALDTDSKKVTDVREHIQAKGLYGKASAVVWDGNALPYVDNLVSLVVMQNGGFQVNDEEVERVLAPRGVAIINGKKTVKPVPPQIDEWRHYLHDADNNAVANDTVVAAPRHMQWLAGPDWIRGHHTLASISAVVTAKGRIFYVLDSATTATGAQVPARWRIVARDAFNGMKLWERDIASWSNARRGFRSGPVQLPRLLVTDGDRVFVPLANDKPVTALDAVTGKVVNTFAGTENAEEILMVDSRLIVYRASGKPAHAVASARGKKKAPAQTSKPAPKPSPGKSVVVIDLKKSKASWSHDVAGDKCPIAQTIASDGKRVYYDSPAGVTALDLANGKELWCTAVGRKRLDISGMGSVLVVSDDVVLAHADKLIALSASDGKILWDAASNKGFRSPPDIFVIDGTVWTGNQFTQAYDLKTGKVAKEIDLLNKVRTVGHHHRCYRSKASVNYLMGAYRGIEMYDLHGDDHSRNNWTRGLCQYGIMPANGLIYAPGHSCSCYMEAKLFGFYAFAPKSRKVPGVDVRNSGERLTKGAALETLKVLTQSPQSSACWPTFRGDAMRRGISSSKVKSAMVPAWTVQLGARLTAPVVSAGLVIVSDIDAHTIHAFDEKDGKELWAFTAGGRVDSPPTIAGDAVVFGCMDGNAYCLSLKNGRPAWTFRAAPMVLNAMSHDQVESVWPVHGSVLVQDGNAYFTAGRNSFIDGGLHMFAVDIATGKQIASNHFVTGHGTAHPQGGQQMTKFVQNAWDIKTKEQPDKSDSFSMGGCANDILSTDGTSIFMHHLRFNKTLENQEKKSRHIFSTSNFADGNENHRSHWFLGYGDFSQTAVAYEWMTGGKNWGSLKSIKGIMLSYDDKAAYVIDRGYELRRHKNRPFDSSEDSQRDFGKKGEGVETAEWKVRLTMRPRAIVKAGDTLVVGGMPADPDTAFPYELVEGKRAGLIQMFSPVDGKLTGEIKLPTAVAWDGIAPANNKLFVSTVDGKLTCLE